MVELQFFYNIQHKLIFLGEDFIIRGGQQHCRSSHRDGYLKIKSHQHPHAIQLHYSGQIMCVGSILHKPL